MENKRVKVPINKSLDNMVSPEAYDAALKMQAFVHNLANTLSFNPSYDSHEGVMEHVQQKQLEFALSAINTLLSGEFVASFEMTRVMFENYISAFNLDKFKNQDAYKTWVLWSGDKRRKKNGNTPFQRETNKAYRDLCAELGTTDQEASYNQKMYGWLLEFNGGNKAGVVAAIEQIDSTLGIYDSFVSMSAYVHSNDFLTQRTSFSDEELLFLLTEQLGCLDDMLFLDLSVVEKTFEDSLDGENGYSTVTDFLFDYRDKYQELLGSFMDVAINCLGSDEFDSIMEEFDEEDKPTLEKSSQLVKSM